MAVNPALGLDAAPARPAETVLLWSRGLIDPALRSAVETLPPAMRRIACYHFGWWDPDGRGVGDLPAG